VPQSGEAVQSQHADAEPTSNNTLDLGVGKSIHNLPQLRHVMRGINDRYLAIEQDVLETYIDWPVSPPASADDHRQRTSETRPEAGLYAGIDQALDQLLDHLGFSLAT